MNGFDNSDLDSTDYRILRALLRDGRASDVKLGEEVNLSSTATARRRKMLEDKGLIPRYIAELDLPRMGYSVKALVSVELTSQAEHVLNEFETAVVQCRSVSFCSFVSGTTDFVMMVHVRSFEDYDSVYRKELSRLPHVARIHSSFLIREVAARTVAPIVVGDER